MGEGDFIKLNRKILDWEWYKNEHTKTVFIHCLLKANWTDGRFEGVVIPRGSFATSYSTLASELGLSVKAVRVALDHLKTTKEVASKAYPKFTVISITNYESYQCNGKDNGKPTASEGQAKGNNRRKEERKKERIEGTPALDSLISKYGADFVNERVERAKGYSGITIEKIAQWCEEDSKKVKPFKKNTFNNFTARTYDFEDVERRLLRKEQQ